MTWISSRGSVISHSPHRLALGGRWRAGDWGWGTVLAEWR